MIRTVIVDYGLCNLDSIARAVEECGDHPLVTDDPRELPGAERIILPGVGSFADAMSNLRERRLDEAMQEEVKGKGVPILGICLGMHLLAGRGHEGRSAGGLGWIDAEVHRLELAAPNERIPHVGWNEVEPAPNATLFKNIMPGKDFYFAHSFRIDCTNPDQIAARTPYCGGFVSAVESNGIFGVQFHPEKSQKAGFQLLRNFLDL